MGELIDLDEYRAMRVVEGTWPPDQKTIVGYWIGRKNKNIKPDYDKRPKGSA